MTTYTVHMAPSADVQAAIQQLGAACSSWPHETTEALPRPRVPGDPISTQEMMCAYAANPDGSMMADITMTASTIVLGMIVLVFVLFQLVKLIRWFADMRRPRGPLGSASSK